MKMRKSNSTSSVFLRRKIKLLPSFIDSFESNKAVSHWVGGFLYWFVFFPDFCHHIPKAANLIFFFRVRITRLGYFLFECFAQGLESRIEITVCFQLPHRCQNTFL